MNTVEDISQYLYSTSVDDLNVEIKDIKELVLLQNEEIRELYDIVRVQSASLYQLKLQIKTGGRR